MILLGLLVGYTVANHEHTAYDMGLEHTGANDFKILHCNNQLTDYPELKIRNWLQFLLFLVLYKLYKNCIIKSLKINL